MASNDAVITRPTRSRLQRGLNGERDMKTPSESGHD